MAKKEVKILSEIRAFDQYFKVDKALVSEKQEDGTLITYNRFKLTRPDAVAVLLLNEDSGRVILVNQYRYPVADREPKGILEIVAGKMDSGETPEQTAIREVEEEVGYKITAEHLSVPKSVYVSPGYSTEKVHIFIARVNDSMIVSKGGGVATEHESLDIVEVDAGEFAKDVREGKISDAKTVIACDMLLLESLETLLNMGARISAK